MRTLITSCILVITTLVASHPAAAQQRTKRVASAVSPMSMAQSDLDKAFKAKRKAEAIADAARKSVDLLQRKLDVATTRQTDLAEATAKLDRLNTTVVNAITEHNRLQGAIQAEVDKDKDADPSATTDPDAVAVLHEQAAPAERALRAAEAEREAFMVSLKKKPIKLKVSDGALTADFKTALSDASNENDGVVTNLNTQLTDPKTNLVKAEAASKAAKDEFRLALTALANAQAVAPMQTHQRLAGTQFLQARAIEKLAHEVESNTTVSEENAKGIRFVGAELLKTNREVDANTKASEKNATGIKAVAAEMDVIATVLTKVEEEGAANAATLRTVKSNVGTSNEAIEKVQDAIEELRKAPIKPHRHCR